MWFGRDKGPFYSKEFRKNCRLMQTEESLDFWLEVEKFRKIKSNNKRITEASRIISTYVEPFAPRQVNLTRKHVDKIMHGYHKSYVEPTLFDESQAHIGLLLEDNCKI